MPENPTVTETPPATPGPAAWPAFRAKLDTAIRAAEDADDVEGWARAVRGRHFYGCPTEVPAAIAVGAAFHARVLALVRDRKRPYPECADVGGRFIINGIPITVRED